MRRADRNLNILAAFHALGALTPSEEEKLAQIISEDESAAALVDEYREAAELLTLSLEAVAPPPEVLHSLLRRIAREEAEEVPPLSEPELHVVAADEGWHDFSIEGIRVKRLTPNGNDGPVSVLITVQPGARYPAHDHIGPEQCLVVSGSFESGGNHRRAGDFILAPAGSADQEIYCQEGATLLVVMSQEDFARAG